MQKIMTIIGAAVLGALGGYVISQSASEKSSTSNSNLDITNRATMQENVNVDSNIVRGPYEADQDGCRVIDLRAVEASEKDPVTKTYTWFVEHPIDAPCVRQTNPVIQEKIIESTNENLRDTNIWKLTFRYE
jgi:hypothetical protein